MDSGRAPDLLAANQLAYACNVRCRGGFIQPRPGMRRLNISFPSGVWQGAEYYDSPTRPGYVCSIAGRILFVDPVGMVAEELTASTDRNSDRNPQVWMEQAEEFMIVQDGEALPFIWNGAQGRRAVRGSRETSEVPTGTVMAYGWGRLWVASPDRKRFTAGNLVYSETFKTSDLLRWSENTFLNGGGFFTVPANAGRINAMRFTAQIDTSVGQGPLMVFTDRGAFSVRAPVEREIWQNLQYPIQTVALMSYGALAQLSTINVNGDIWYRARDGVRSLALAQSQYGQWVNTPTSKEMARVMEQDSKQPALLERSSAVLFDNRLLMTALPQNVRGYGTVHMGLVVLDFDPLSTMSTRQPPAWDGLWSGGRFLQIVKGVFKGQERCHVFVLNDNDAVELWEITRDEHWDNGDENIAGFYETRAFEFAQGAGGGRFNRKQLRTLELWRDRMLGTVLTDVKYKPDQHPFWVDWHDWEDCITARSCSIPQDICPTVRMYQPQYRPRVRLPEPSSGCDPILNRPYNEASTFQIRIEFEGYCRFKQMRLSAMTVEENPNGGCPVATDCIGLTGCTSPGTDETPQAGETEDVLGTSDGETIVTSDGDQILINP
jgi:hypothetical protein